MKFVISILVLIAITYAAYHKYPEYFYENGLLIIAVSLLTYGYLFVKIWRGNKSSISRDKYNVRIFTKNIDNRFYCKALKMEMLPELGNLLMNTGLSILNL